MANEVKNYTGGSGSSGVQVIRLGLERGEPISTRPGHIMSREGEGEMREVTPIVFGTADHVTSRSLLHRK